MAAFSTYLEKAILDQVLQGTNYTAAADVYFGLSTTTITNASGPTEPSGSAYARVAITNDATNWPNATSANPASKSNGTAITFATATGSWGTVTDYFVADALTSGNILFFGVLTTAQTISNGDTPSVAIGGLTLTLA